MARAGGLLALLMLFGASSIWAKDKPNVVPVVMDNLGWGEIGVYGGGILRGAKTPRLDRLASEGIQFLNFNVETQCTPSRSALMTGRHPIRSGTTQVVWGQLYGMTQWEITIAELLSDAGYATGMFGKWHLGEVEGRFPTDQGFDEWYGIANTTDESVYTDGFQFDPQVVEVPHNRQDRWLTP
jgi:arylsulfatase